MFTISTVKKFIGSAAALTLLVSLAPGQAGAVTASDELVDGPYISGGQEFTPGFQDAVADSIVELTNGIRLGIGVNELRRDGSLEEASRGWAVEVADSGELTHSGYRDRGENLYWSSVPLSGEEIVNGWMRSPEHRENIESIDYQTIGVGVYYDEDGGTWAVQQFR